MKDKNGIEIKTGNIVEISGAYFKNDNGFYFVDNSPGDPSWCGSDHCLKKISKAGKISKSTRNICFWPIGVFVSNRAKAAEANKWNRENATIEVKTISNMDEVVAHFLGKAEELEKSTQRMEWDFGEESEPVKRNRAIQIHYEAVAQAIRG